MNEDDFTIYNENYLGIKLLINLVDTYNNG